MKRQTETGKADHQMKRQRLLSVDSTCNRSEHCQPQCGSNTNFFRPLSFSRFLEEATFGSRSSSPAVSYASRSNSVNQTDGENKNKKVLLERSGAEISKDVNVQEKSNQEEVINYSARANSLEVPKDRDEVKDIHDLISKGFKNVALCGLFCWILLLCAVYTVTPSENIIFVNEVEFLSAAAGAMLIIISMASKYTPRIIRGSSNSTTNGVLVGAIAVQFISIITDTLPLFLKIPIMIDPVTGAKVYLTRYCAWTPQAFMMTFFTEIAVAPEILADSSVSSLLRCLKAPLLHSIAQGLSAFLGLVFPFCKSFSAWMTAMACSLALFLTIFVRIHVKRKFLQGLKPGSMVADVEHFERCRISYNMVLLCAALWSAFVFLYFFVSFTPKFVSENSFLKHESLPFICETLMDVLAKALYVDVIVKLHNSVFDSGVRARRRLEELKRMMLVFWECSADYIVLSVQGKDGVITTMLSPSFLTLGNTKGKNLFSTTTAIMFKQAMPRTFNSEYSILTEKSKSFRLSPDSDLYTALEKPLSSVRDLVFQCWDQDATKSVILCDIALPNGTCMNCEGKVTRYKGDALIVVVRDISERRRRLEAEKLLLSEQTARMKDAEANRFTRHEVKNGLLACIELTECLKESLCLAPGVLSNTVNEVKSNIAVRELESHLQVVYDTIMAVAMARDVINENYDPKVERVDLCQILPTSFSFHVNDIHRFPLVTFPSPFPIFMLDPQLLRFIHGNAVSNACKYGQKDGVVLTEVHYQKDKGMIALKVINSPGDSHQEILQMGEDAEKRVFEPRERLHLNFRSDCALSSG